MEVGRTYGFKCTFDFYRFYRPFISLITPFVFSATPYARISPLVNVKLEPICIVLCTEGCTTKYVFFQQQKISTTHHASVWGLVWRDPKGFLISTNFRGSSSHFCFDHFYIVDFHSALTFAKRDLRREDWVKIYKLTLDKGLISGESADVVEKLFHVI